MLFINEECEIAANASFEMVLENLGRARDYLLSKGCLLESLQVKCELEASEYGGERLVARVVGTRPANDKEIAKDRKAKQALLIGLKAKCKMLEKELKV